MPGTTHLIKWVGGCSPEWVILKLYQGGGLHGTNHAHTCYYEFPLSYYDTQIVAYGHVLRMLDIKIFQIITVACCHLRYVLSLLIYQTNIFSGNLMYLVLQHLYWNPIYKSLA